MQYFGKFLIQVKRKHVALPYHLEGKCVQIVCIKTDTGELYLTVLPSDSESVMELPASYEILQKEICCLYNSLKLPESFLEYLDGNKVVVVGVGNHIELFSEPYFTKLENPPMTMDEFADTLEKIGL